MRAGACYFKQFTIASRVWMALTGSADVGQPNYPDCSVS